MIWSIRKLLSRILLMIVISLISFDNLQAQSDSIISYYLDDGGISNGKNIIKFNTTSILDGDLPLHYERVFSDRFSVEVGVGVLIPFSVSILPNLIFDESNMENSNYGYSIWFHPKYYLQQNAPELNYVGFQLIRRNYYQTITYTDITINYGLQFFLGKRFILDYNVGVGFKFKTTRSINNEICGLALPIGIKLGIIL